MIFMVFTNKYGRAVTVGMYALGQSVIFHLSKKYAALLAYLKVGDNGMLYIFFLFLQEVK